MASKKIACLGDPASHPGSIISAGQSKVKSDSTAVAVDGALFQCSVEGHGTTAITPITTKTFINGNLIVTEGATAACGAVINPPDRKVYIDV
jgi:uncharacterized Zn-binding protein involved in type VI secretion